MEKQELDIIKFNKEFEENDLLNDKYKEKPPIKQVIPHSQKNNLDYMILKMRLAFDFILNKISNYKNPIDDILADEELTQGTIYLSLFLGVMTMILAGLFKS